jgi:hypothetical protein
MSSLGDVSDLSTNASIMLKISIVSAWAELQSSSVRQTYLKAVLEPHRPKLAPFWVTSLRDLARIRTDPDAGPGSSASGDFMSSGLGREVLLPYYERSWAPILQAVATMMEENDRDILYAMDGIDPPSTSSTSASTPQLPERLRTRLRSPCHLCRRRLLLSRLESVRPDHRSDGHEEPRRISFLRLGATRGSDVRRALHAVLPVGDDGSAGDGRSYGPRAYDVGEESRSDVVQGYCIVSSAVVLASLACFWLSLMLLVL